MIALACLVGKHLAAIAYDQSGECGASWCLWCGSAVYDPDLIDDDGDPIGFTPTYAVQVPDGFHRRLEDAT